MWCTNIFGSITILSGTSVKLYIQLVVASIESIMALFENGITGGESIHTGPDRHCGGPTLLDCSSHDETIILNFTIRHFKTSIPRSQHKFLSKLANMIILLHNVSCHGMMGHDQASRTQPELSRYNLHVFTPLTKSLSVKCFY
jgi:hypothetical protein